MTQTIQRAKKIGGSLMLRIPKDIVELEHIQPGEAIQMEIKKLRKDWFGAFPTLKTFTKEDRLHSRYE
ncbi:AbrB/MazE/SpoVT family DNA-binding domain-containing protein [Candidatus Woesearchaeota archaeon]|nr:AbrB/MazE/SpoVT family DNA-binding domain-containing protein [Candidatus Woesearchaeota archaeon]